MNKRVWLIAGLLAGLNAPAWSQDLVLGLSHAKTGRYAGVAVGTEIAVDIAVAEINAAGGVNGRKIRIEKFDTGGEARNAQVAVHGLRAQVARPHRHAGLHARQAVKTRAVGMGA